MKFKATLFTAIVLLPALCAAQTPESASPLKEMIQTEQAFSKTAEVKTTRDAFLEFIADDGLLFRPAAVNGKKWLIEHPPQPSEKRPLLAWQPSFAQMSLAGDLGFTTGPWEFKSDIKDARPSGYGHFVTLWKKQPDGKWKFVVDLGISHPQSGGPLTIWKVENNPAKIAFKSIDIAKINEQLMQRDRSYATEASKLGWAKAFEGFASNDARLYFNDHLPYVGRTLAAEIIGQTRETIVYHPGGGDVSRSGDLGYTHGTYEKMSAADAKKVVEHGNYLRIWKKDDKVWQIVLDVTNPVP